MFGTNTERAIFVACFALGVFLLALITGIGWAQTNRSGDRRQSDIDDARPVETATVAGSFAAIPEVGPANEQDRIAVDSLVYLTPSAKSLASADDTGMTAVLGVHVRPTDVTLQRHLKLPRGVGLVVEHVVAESAAEEAGIEAHDVLRALDDQLLVNREQLGTLITMRKPGEAIEVEYYRDGKKRSASATLKPGAPPAATMLLDADEQAPENWLDLSTVHDFDDRKIHNCESCHKVSYRLRDASMKWLMQSNSGTEQPQ